MEMQGSRQLGVTQQQAWDALNDPEVLKICIPGCDKVEAAGDNQYVIAMALKIGPVSAKFTGKIVLSDVVPPESYTISFEGQGGPAGFGKGNAKVKLVPNDAGCELGYSVQAQVGGKVAQLGQRLIDGAAKSIAEDFFKRFDLEMQRRFAAPEAALPTDALATAASGAGDGAAGRPKAGVSVPTWAWVAVAAAVAAGVAVLR